jgi:branched-chain amino acid aminotransferase
MLSILAREMDVPSPEAYAKGVGVVTVGPRRIPPACLDGTLKMTSYGAQVLARREVAARGAAEGIQLTIDGALACGTMASLFLVRGRDLLTPSLESGCRAGVTRGAILELARASGLVPVERRLEPAMLDDVDEAFLASTRVECLPIATVDGRRLGARSDSGDSFSFPRTTALRAAFGELVRRERAARSARS